MGLFQASDHGWSVMADYGAGATSTMANVFLVGTNWDNLEADDNLEDVDV